MDRDMEIKNFRCNGSINEIKVDLANVYKTANMQWKIKNPFNEKIRKFKWMFKK